jgi:hypothetical protein
MVGGREFAMLRLIGPVSAVAACFLVAGCKTGTPSINPFAGYGAPRVPPPATGSYGKPDTYYPGTTPPAGSSRGTSLQLPPSANSALSAGNGWRPVGGLATPDAFSTSSTAVGSGVPSTLPTSGVNQAVYEPPVSPIYGQPAGPTFAQPPNPTFAAPTQPSGSATSGFRFPTVGTVLAPTAAPASVAANPTKLKPMPVNDATQTGEPGRFIPYGAYTDISQLPTPTRAALPANGIRGLAPQQYSAAPATYITPQPGAATSVVGTTDTQLGWRPKYVPSAAGVTTR